LLNVHAAHLDYHGSMENYVQAKANIIKNQTAEDYFIYNMDDTVVTRIASEAKAKLIGFSTQQKHVPGVWMEEDYFYFKEEKIVLRRSIRLFGNHNLENIDTAISIVLSAGGSKDGVRIVLQTFSGVKYRLQFVQAVEVRLFYNDSKSTNRRATEKSLQALEQPTILLAG